MSDDYTIESNCNRLESILGDLEREGLKEGTEEYNERFEELSVLYELEVHPPTLSAWERNQ